MGLYICSFLSQRCIALHYMFKTKTEYLIILIQHYIRRYRDDLLFSLHKVVCYIVVKITDLHFKQSEFHFTFWPYK